MRLPLVRLGRTERFRRMIDVIPGNLRSDPADLAAQLLSSVALVATALRRDLTEADCWRLADAFTLIVVSPAAADMEQ